MLESIAITTLQVLAWFALLIGIGGSIASLPNEPGTVLWLFAGVLGWALLIVIASVAYSFLTHGGT
jgi:hypothetical protein